MCPSVQGLGSKFYVEIEQGLQEMSSFKTSLQQLEFSLKAGFGGEHYID